MKKLIFTVIAFALLTACSTKTNDENQLFRYSLGDRVEACAATAS